MMLTEMVVNADRIISVLILTVHLDAGIFPGGMNNVVGRKTPTSINQHGL